MDRDSRCSRSSKSRCIWIVLVLVVLLQPAPARAGEAPSASPAQAGFVSSPLPAWSLNNLFSPVQSALGNRRRMIQFATIGMCIGLYILMRK
jgi:hypothetical protein